jgi:DNA-binding response OmpR family regulator
MRNKIICIEDDRETAVIIVEELEDCGFESSAAYGGRAGLFAIARDTPDLIPCDITHAERHAGSMPLGSQAFANR